MNQSTLLQNQPTLTHEARSMIIRIGRVLERCIEDRAEELASSRSDAKVVAKHVFTVTSEFLDEELAGLSQLIKEALGECSDGISKAA